MYLHSDRVCDTHEHRREVRLSLYHPRKALPSHFEGDPSQRFEGETFGDVGVVQK